MLEKKTKEVVRGALSDKTFLDSFKEQLETYLDGEFIARRMQINFNKPFSLRENQALRTETQKTGSGYNTKENIKIIDQENFLGKLRQQAQNQILNYIKIMEPGVTETEVVVNPEGLDIVSKNAIYKVLINTGTITESIDTDISTPLEETMKNQRDKPSERVYHHPNISGNIVYVKFNQEHNQGLLKFLKEKGYNINVNIKGQ